MSETPWQAGSRNDPLTRSEHALGRHWSRPIGAVEAFLIVVAVVGTPAMQAVQGGTLSGWWASTILPLGYLVCRAIGEYRGATRRARGR